MPQICKKCLKMMEKLSKQKLEEKDLGHETCRKCGFLRPYIIRKINLWKKKK